MMTKYRKPEPPLVRMYQGPSLEEQDRSGRRGLGALLCFVCLFLLVSGFIRAMSISNGMHNDEMVTLRDGTICAVRNKREITCNEGATKVEQEHFRESNPPIVK